MASNEREELEQRLISKSVSIVIGEDLAPLEHAYDKPRPQKTVYGFHIDDLMQLIDKYCEERERLAEEEGMRVAYMKAKFLIDDSLQPKADIRKIVRMRVASKMVGDELSELQAKENK